MINLELWKFQKKKLNLTFDELASISQVSRRTICNIFSGEIESPRLDTVQAIEKALGLDNQAKTEYTDEEKELFNLITQLTDEEVEELSKFVDFIISKRK